MFSLAPDFQISLFHWALAFLAAFLLGVSKSGIKGISVIIVTIMAMVFGAKASTGIIMPLLIGGDIFAVTYYRRDTEWKYLFKLLPWMIVGVLLGVWVGKDLPEDLFKKGMAVIILLTVAMMFWWDNRKAVHIPAHWTFASFMGLGAGFTTMIGNLAGAFSNIYFLAMRLPKNAFIGTAAWLFFIINLFKLPFHIFYWETINWSTFAVNLRLLPALAIGFVAGVRLVKIIKEEHYRKMILILTAFGALIMLIR